MVIDAIVDASVDSLMYFTFVLIVVALIVAVVALVWERRREFGRPSMETPPRTLGHWVREHAPVVLGWAWPSSPWSPCGRSAGLRSPCSTAAALLLLAIAVKVLSDSDRGRTEPRTATEG